MKVSIEIPVESDRPEWEKLYYGYAEFYEAPMNQEILDTVWSWIRDVDNPVYGIIAKLDNRLVGFMHYREMPSPLRGAKIGFLDDLFVSPEYRGGGVVDALFARLSEEGKKNRWPCIRWITREDNYRARYVYDRLSEKTNWVTYQLDL